MRSLNPEKIEFLRYDSGEVDIYMVWPDGYRETVFPDESSISDWGKYPSCCARGILLELVAQDDFYRELSANFIAKIPREGGELDVSVILSWLAMKEQHYELPLGV